jgi:DeoR family fructose operon transcriptional repressor
MREHETEKMAIARAAAELVTDGSTIIIDSGSTTVHFARALEGKRDIVVVTNAVTNARELMENEDITVVLTGGLVRRTTFGATGDLAVATLRELHVDQTFLAINSASLDDGLMYPSFEEVAVKRAMIAAASEVILLADSSKFSHKSLIRVAPLTVLSRIVTDSGIDPNTAAAVLDLGIDVVVAPLPGDRTAADDPSRPDDPDYGVTENSGAGKAEFDFETDGHRTLDRQSSEIGGGAPQEGGLR